MAFDAKRKNAKKHMKALNLNGKIMIIPMAALDEKVRSAIKQEDGLQNIGGTDIFVYATGRLEEHPHQCCGGEGHHHHHEDGHQCCGGEGHHHHHEDGHQCCGGGHNTDEFYDHDEADETFIDEEDNYAGDQDDDLGTVRVINEPVVIVNTDDVAKLEFPVEDDMFLRLSPEGLTLLPGADVDKGGFQTGAITIRLEEE